MPCPRFRIYVAQIVSELIGLDVLTALKPHRCNFFFLGFSYVIRHIAADVELRHLIRDRFVFRFA